MNSQVTIFYPDLVKYAIQDGASKEEAKDIATLTTSLEDWASTAKSERQHNLKTLIVRLYRMDVSRIFTDAHFNEIIRAIYYWDDNRIEAEEIRKDLGL